MQKSHWNKASWLLFTVPYAVAYAIAFRLDHHSRFGGEWDSYDTETTWTLAMATFLIALVVTVVATIYDAIKRRPLQPIGVFNYATFLFVTIMFAAMALSVAADAMRPATAT